MLLDCFPLLFPPCHPDCQNHPADFFPYFSSPRDPPNRVGHPSETGRDPSNRVGPPSETGLDPPNRVGHPPQTSQHPPKCMGGLPNPVIPAILSQSYLAFPPAPRLCPQLGSILSVGTLEQLFFLKGNRCFYWFDLTTYLVLNFTPTRPNTA
jgi:hypothetical protein